MGSLRFVAWVVLGCGLLWGEAIVSPSGKKTARVAADNSIEVTDLAGNRLASFQAMTRMSSDVPCNSILSIQWMSEDVIGTECHVNPSMSEWIETSLATGKVVRDFYGLYFTPSPDRKHVAHVGPIIHFAPPYAQSYVLEIDGRVLYPRMRNDQDNPVKKDGLSYSGIHEFGPEIAWAPDGARVALVDCTFTWTAHSVSSLSAGDGEFSKRACFLTVVGMDSQFEAHSLEAGVAREAKVEWRDSRRVKVVGGGKSRTFAVR